MCRRRYQTYHTDPLNSQAVFIAAAPLGRRHRCTPRRHYKADKRQLRHQYKHPELYSVAQHQEDLYPVSHVPQRVPQQAPDFAGGARDCHTRRRGPVSGMAALLLGAIGFGTVKIQESREKKKAKKAALEWEAEQSAAKTAKAASRRGNSSSEEALDETRNFRTDNDGELPPPAYEDVVSPGGRNGNVTTSANRSGGRVEMPAVVPSELSAQKTGASGRRTMLDV